MPEGQWSFASMMGSWLQRVWRRWRGWCHRGRCSELSHQIDAALQNHDLAPALKGLELQLCLDCSHHVERLLFVRQSRPASQQMSLNLFMAMADLPNLREHHRFYLLIATIHNALQLDDTACLTELKPRLSQAACLEHAPSRKLIVSGRNREHPFKQLISARSCLLQVALRDQNMVTCQRIASANLELLEMLPWTKLPADVLLRSTTNLVKALLPCCVLDQQRGRVQTSLSRLEQQLSGARFDALRSSAREDHLLFLRSVLAWLDAVKTNGESVELLNQLRSWLLSNDASSVRAGSQQLTWIGLA
jgi:hypothetical protein